MQIDCLHDVGVVVGNGEDSKSGRFWQMRNGYALPSSDVSMSELSKLLTAEPERAASARDALRVAIHWDTSVKVSTPSTHIL